MLKNDEIVQIQIRRETLFEHDACREGIAWFDETWPSGIANIYWGAVPYMWATSSKSYIINGYICWAVAHKILPQPNLNGFDFSGTDLKPIYFGPINFSDMDCRYANFCKSNFSFVNFSNANCQGADLSNANLRGANFYKTDLSNANLIDADLSDANLQYANLYNANLTRANLQNADLGNANLNYTIVRGVNLDLCKNNRSNLNKLCRH
jgi:uncharacterized protein YjbI with pentapeptide repeats